MSETLTCEINKAESNKAKARELMEDVFTRSLTMDMLITDVNPRMMIVMGLARVDFGEEIKAASKAVMGAFDGIEEI